MKEESLLTKVLKQEPTVYKTETKSLHDKAKEEGVPFEVVFERAVKNVNHYDIDLNKAVKNLTRIQWSELWRLIKACWNYNRKK